MKVAYNDIGKLQFARARHFLFPEHLLYHPFCRGPAHPGRPSPEIATAAAPGAEGERVVGVLVIYF